MVPFGWSEGGATAAALYAVSGEDFEVSAVGVGDPPNSVKRHKSSLIEQASLVKDFLSPDGGDGALAEAQKARLPALSEALNVNESEFTKRKNYYSWMLELAMVNPLGRIAIFTGDSVYRDVAEGLSRHENSIAVLFNAQLSSITPNAEFAQRAALLQSEFGRVIHIQLEGSGHFAMDQVFDQAVIADLVVNGRNTD